MKRLAFHVISTKDTLDFKLIYDGLDDIKVVNNPTKSDVIRELTDNPGIDVIFIGHGDSGGLYNENLEEYCVNKDTVPLLKNRFVIGIWCFAAEFADIYNLRGFFTSDFISNKEEFFDKFLTDNISDEEIIDRNKNFSYLLSNLIKNDIDPSSWISSIQKEANSPIERYNYEALSLFL